MLSSQEDPLFADCLVATLLTASFASLIVQDVSFFESGPLVSGREPVCKLKIAIKSHRDLYEAAERRSLAPPCACACPTMTSYLLHLFKFSWFLFSHIPTIHEKREILHRVKISRYTVIVPWSHLSILWNSPAFRSVITLVHSVE